MITKYLILVLISIGNPPTTMPFGACDVEQKIRGVRNETRNGILFYSDQDIKPEGPKKCPFLSLFLFFGITNFLLLSQ